MKEIRFNSDEIKVLKKLITTSTYLSSYDLSSSTGIARRRIRDLIKQIKDKLELLGYTLYSKPSKGYILETNSSFDLDALNEYIDQYSKSRESLYPTLPQEMMNYIMKRMIDLDDYILIDDLADELLVSRSLISQELKDLKKDLFKYGLTLVHKPHYGVNIVGNEKGKRNLLCDFLFMNIHSSNYESEFIGSFMQNKDLLEYKIIEVFHKYDIVFSDIALCDLLLCFITHFQRTLEGYRITEDIDDRYIKDRIELEAAKDIAKLFHEEYNIVFNTNEVYKIAIEILCKRTFYNIELIQDDTANTIVERSLREIEEQTGIIFDNLNFIDVLKQHVYLTVIRLFYIERNRSPIYDSVHLAYPLAHYITWIIANNIEKYTGFRLTRSSFVPITFLIEDQLSKMKHERLDTLVIGSMESASNSLMLQNIDDHFGKYLKIIDISSLNRLTHEAIMNCDLIISNIPLDNKINKPHINVSSFLDTNDLNAIDHYISYHCPNVKFELLFHPNLYKETYDNDLSIAEILSKFRNIIKKEFSEEKSVLNNTIDVRNIDKISEFDNIHLIELNTSVLKISLFAILIQRCEDIKQSKIYILHSQLHEGSHEKNTLIERIDHITNEELITFFKEPSYYAFIKLLNTKANDL